MLTAPFIAAQIGIRTTTASLGLTHDLAPGCLPQAGEAGAERVKMSSLEGMKTKSDLVERHHAVGLPRGDGVGSAPRSHPVF
jgi:hypothetical protein